MQYQLTLKDFVMNFHSSKRKLILKTFAVGFLGLHAEAASCISALKTDWKFNYNFSCEKEFLQKVNAGGIPLLYCASCDMKFPLGEWTNHRFG